VSTDSGSAAIYEFGRFCLDLDEHRLTRDRQPVPLTPKVFDLLRVLVENAGHLIDKDRLLKEVWSDAFVEEANLNRAISVLRKALGETAGERFIETVPKKGYRFVAPVRLQTNGVPVLREASGHPPVPADPPNHAAGRNRLHLLSTRTVGIAAGTILALGAILYLVLGRGARSGHVVATGPSIHRQVTFTGRETIPTLSPDGRRIAYVSTQSPNRKVLVQEVDGGESVEVFSAPEAGGLRWSPDSSELMFWARGGEKTGLYIAPRAGGGARRLGGGPVVACWSPDGSTIAIAAFVARKIGFINRLGQQQRFIALQGVNGFIYDLDWSPVHGRLLFVVNDDAERPAVWTIRPDGTEQTRIYTASSEIAAARWAPGGDAIYFFGRVNQTFSLYKVAEKPLGGTVPVATPLISGLQSDGTFGLSVDGGRLAHSRAPYHSNLWMVETPGPDTANRVRQTQLTSGTSVIERPRVSPDGTSILFTMGYEGRTNLYTIPSAGGPPKQLTFLNAFSPAGAWSPDGRSVAFATTEGGKARVWLVRADGATPRPVSIGDMSDSYDITWAPGERPLYQQTGNRNFYVMDPRTQRERLLVKDSSVGWMGSVAYSPDGKQIAVSWNRRLDGRYTPSLWTVDSEGAAETLVYRPTDPNSGPMIIGWARDGHAVYAFDGKRAANRGVAVSLGETVTDVRVLKVPLNGGTPQTVLSLPFDEIGSVTMFPDERRFLCTVYTSSSDVWIVENFDVSSEDRIARRPE
jgi:Tol biopolymer transport system component/DNA-binding winged helix-turn-helix (wHTH) protein